MDEKMYAYKCTACGELHHPKHYVCKKCGNRTFEEVLLRRRSNTFNLYKSI